MEKRGDNHQKRIIERFEGILETSSPQLVNIQKESLNSHRNRLPYFFSLEKFIKKLKPNFSPKRILMNDSFFIKVKGKSPL